MTHRSGDRPRDWDTRAGTIELAIPRVRQGSYLPSILEPRRRAERALTAVVATVLCGGCGDQAGRRRRPRDGLNGISKSQVSRMCAELDEVVAAWRSRPLGRRPVCVCVLDAVVVKVREHGRVGNTAALVAAGVNADGHREVLGLDVGAVEDGAAWTARPGSGAAPISCATC